jgi:hypothetical protein
MKTKTQYKWEPTEVESLLNPFAEAVAEAAIIMAEVLPETHRRRIGRAARGDWFTLDHIEDANTSVYLFLERAKTYEVKDDEEKCLVTRLVGEVFWKWEALSEAFHVTKNHKPKL